MGISMYVRIYGCMYVRMYIVCMYVCMYDVCTYVCMYVSTVCKYCMYVCIYVGLYGCSVLCGEWK